MSKSDAGKGDRPRPVDHKKWDAWWDQYETKKKRYDKTVAETMKELLE